MSELTHVIGITFVHMLGLCGYVTSNHALIVLLLSKQSSLNLLNESEDVKMLDVFSSYAVPLVAF